MTSEQTTQPGYLIPIGGAERKRRSPTILRRFVELAGGNDARIAVIPTASKLDTTGPTYEEVFRGLGAEDARSLPFRSRSDCDNPEWLEVLNASTGIFMTGGSQLRLSRTLGATPVARAIRDAHAKGTHVAGTSAGASYMSEHMIAFGDAGASPVTHMVALAPGLGLTQELTIDQHFRERDRLGRLLTVLAYNPDIVGLGLDEDTAAFIGPDKVLEVVGSGSCTLVDGSELEHASVGHQPGDPVSLLGVKLHILLPGARYEVQNRRAIPPQGILDREVQAL
ncbi:MAG: cyanophycinase [Acidobacteria bacterium]|nr:cyanophycinase [Acidobacteriota bacterium]